MFNWIVFCWNSCWSYKEFEEGYLGLKVKEKFAERTDGIKGKENWNLKQTRYKLNLLRDYKCYTKKMWRAYYCVSPTLVVHTIFVRWANISVSKNI